MKSVTFFLGMVICCIISTTSFAEEITIVTENFPPFNYEEPTTGKIAGLGTEIVQAVLEEVSVQANIMLLPWARAYKMAQREKM